MKLNRFFLVFFVAFFLRVNAQHWCGFEEVNARLDSTNHAYYEKELKRFLANKPRGRGEEDILTIPVAVHILHNNATEEIGIGANISDDQVNSAIQVLNDYFRRNHADTVNTPARFRSVAADIRIEFCLASQDPAGNLTNGITRHRTNRAVYNTSFADERLVKSLGYWPSDEYLNIWVTRLSGNILGYAYFPEGTPLQGLNNRNRPELDGVVISPFVFGNNIGLASGSGNPYRFGKTLVHEVGHWLGLRHTFDETGETCSYTDYCDDTPTQAKPNTFLDDCSEVVFGKCNEIVMHQNYMDYTKDACLNIFTQDQKERMRTAMDLSPRRKALRFSAGCCGSNLIADIPTKIDFSDESLFLSNWELGVQEESTSLWALEDERLIAQTGLSPNDSLILSSGTINYKRNDDLFLRLNASSKNADSIHFFYERACSGEFVLFHKELLSSNVKDIQIALSDLTNDGLLNIYVVIYASGNEVYLDDLQLYENRDLDFTIYPNPTDSDLTILLSLEEDQEVVVEVFSLQGKKTLALDLGKVNSGVFKVGLPGLMPGLYLLRISADNSDLVKKFTVR